MDFDDPLVAVVDDDSEVVRALDRVLASSGWQVVSYGSGSDFLADFDPHRPGCVLLDMRMPSMGGLEVQKRLRELGSRTPVLFMSGYADVPSTVEALKLGALDCLQKPIPERELLGAVEHAVRHDRETRRIQAESARIAERVATLTAREREIMDWVVQGKLNKQIAAECGISERTVEVHRHRVMVKMGADSPVGLLRMLLDAAKQSPLLQA